MKIVFPSFRCWKINIVMQGEIFIIFHHFFANTHCCELFIMLAQRFFFLALRFLYWFLFNINNTKKTPNCFIYLIRNSETLIRFRFLAMKLNFSLSSSGTGECLWNGTIPWGNEMSIIMIRRGKGRIESRERVDNVFTSYSYNFQRIITWSSSSIIALKINIKAKQRARASKNDDDERWINSKRCKWNNR